jgi:hypothetical protein
MRGLIVNTLDQDAWKNEFIATGLIKLAGSIGGAPAVSARNGIDAATAKDIKLEFYLLLRAQYDKLDYKDFFTTNKVMVSEKTAPFYQGCKASGAIHP